MGIRSTWALRGTPLHLRSEAERIVYHMLTMHITRWQVRQLMMYWVCLMYACREAGRHACMQADRQTGRHAGMQGRQAGMQAGW